MAVMDKYNDFVNLLIFLLRLFLQLLCGLVGISSVATFVTLWGVEKENPVISLPCRASALFQRRCL